MAQEVENNFINAQKNLTKDFEGLDLHPYRDSVGKITIGYGRNLTDKGLSLVEATYLFEVDIVEAIEYAQTYPFFHKLSPARQHVVVDMIFNLGGGGFGMFKKVHAALEAHNYELAATEMLRSLWAGQVKARATRLAKIMREGVI